MMWNTAFLLPGVLLTPVTLLAGPQASLTLALTLSIAGSAASAFWVLRRWDASRPAAAIGGAVYGFSPALLNSGTGHYHLTLAVIPPLMIDALLRIVTGRGRPVRDRSLARPAHRRPAPHRRRTTDRHRRDQPDPGGRDRGQPTARGTRPGPRGRAGAGHRRRRRVDAVRVSAVGAIPRPTARAQRPARPVVGQPGIFRRPVRQPAVSHPGQREPGGRHQPRPAGGPRLPGLAADRGPRGRRHPVPPRPAGAVRGRDLRGAGTVQPRRRPADDRGAATARVVPALPLAAGPAAVRPGTAGPVLHPGGGRGRGGARVLARPGRSGAAGQARSGAGDLAHPAAAALTGGAVSSRSRWPAWRSCRCSRCRTR